MRGSTSAARKPTQTISDSLGYTPDELVLGGHAAKMGPAAFIAWCGIQAKLRRGGSEVEIPDSEVAQWLGQSERHARRAVSQLADQGFVARRREGVGYRYSPVPMAQILQIARRLDPPEPVLRPKGEGKAKQGVQGDMHVPFVRAECPECSTVFDVECPRCAETNQQDRPAEGTYMSPSAPISPPAGDRGAGVIPFHRSPESPTNGDPWLAVKKRIMGRIPQVAYRNWLAPTHLLRHEGDRIEVSIPSDATRAWLEEEYRDLIAGALAEAGHANVSVVYEVSVPATETAPLRVAAVGLRERLEAFVPLALVGGPLPDHLWGRIETGMDGVPWECLRDVIRAKERRITSWAFVADHLVKDARAAYQRGMRVSR